MAIAVRFEEECILNDNGRNHNIITLDAAEYRDLQYHEDAT